MISNQYTKFFKKIVIVLIVLIIADQVTGYLIRRLYYNMVAGENYRTTFSVDSTRADILVFGSSRASHHYVPEFFEKKFSMNFYNTGRDGNYVLSNYANFKAVMKRYSPKIIIFDLNPNDLVYRLSDYERLSAYLPYYTNHQELREIIELRSPFEKYKLLSATYPYNSQILRILFRNLSKTREDDNKGYMPLYIKMKISNAKKYLQESAGTIDLNKINALKDISETCIKNNITLFIVCSPIFSDSKIRFTSTIIEDITRHKLCTYFDYSSDSTFVNHPEYFMDNVHLNDDGAKIFSNIISSKMSDYIKSSL